MTQKLHLKAPGNWINDPNGFIYYKGQYHLFYQYFPFGPIWGKMHWGHAVSDDLFSWDHKKVALFPTKYADQDGCFSGSSIEHDGTLFLYYTGVRYTEINPENIHESNDKYESSQMMLTSKDGVKFDNFHDKRMILPPITDRKLGDSVHTRDPKVWRGKDGWYMVLGTAGEDGNGKLLFYRSDDLYQWNYVNSFSRDGYGWMWECPDYFRVNDQDLLIFSPMGIMMDSIIGENQSVCTKVDFDEDTCEIRIPDDYQYIDYGFDLYAPQTTLDEKGRRVMVAWLRMPKAVDDEWNGMFCTPRVVEVIDGHIYFRVHPNIKSKFTKEISSIHGLSQECLHISVDVEEGDYLNIGGYEIEYINHCIQTDRTKLYEGIKEGGLIFASPEVEGNAHLDIYVDQNMIEVFINDGESVITNVVYGMTDDLMVNTKHPLRMYVPE